MSIIMPRTTEAFLQDILESIERIDEYILDLSEQEFWQNHQVQDAVMQRIKIIGEATKNLPRRLRQQYQEISWRDIAGMRDIVSHHYYGVDHARVWQVVDRDLPALKPQIEQILKAWRDHDQSTV